MTRDHKFLIVMVVMTVGVWGCSQGDSKSSSSSKHSERIKSLEAKCSGLEEECSASRNERDQMKTRMGDLEKERGRLVKMVEVQKAIIQERDDLKALVTSRTTERDTYQGQLMDLRKSIRTLLTRVESALPAQESSEEKTTTTPKL